jgi:hypothetical protein
MSKQSGNTRRDFIRFSAIVGTGLVLSGCAGPETRQRGQQSTTSASPKEDEKDENKQAER